MTKLTLLLQAAFLLFFTSCKKENTPRGVNESLPTGTTLVTGSIVSGVHTSSGTVKVVRDASGKFYLAFENFKTDNGPDLRIWLSPNNTGNPYQEVGTLKAVSGNFSYELSTTINYTTNNRVLIWCKGFSVLFGNAVLQ